MNTTRSIQRQRLEECAAALVIAAIAFCFLMLFTGCATGGQTYRDQKAAVVLTPNGYKAIYPENSRVRPSLSTFDHATLLSWVDARVEAWKAERRPEYGDRVDAAARGVTITLVNDYQFPTDESPTGFAHGAVVGVGAVFACIYESAGPTLPADGIGLIVLGHEMDHVLGIDHP